jgi:hypothetical protein
MKTAQLNHDWLIVRRTLLQGATDMQAGSAGYQHQKDEQLLSFLSKEDKTFEDEIENLCADSRNNLS